MNDSESLPKAVPLDLSVAAGVEKSHHGITLFRTERGWNIANRDECFEQVALPLGVRPLSLAGSSHCDDVMEP